MIIRYAEEKDFIELRQFYDGMCKVLSEKDFLPEGDKGGFPPDEMIKDAIKERNQSICRIVALTYRFNDCITSVSHPNLREVFGLDYFGIAQRKEDGLFLFSQVQPFHDGIAHPLCSECAEVESEGNYRFKVVKLHAALVG